MSERTFRSTIILIAVTFTVIFCWLIIPPLVAKPDIAGAFAAGFVNPYASGYSSDVFACWFILTTWVVYEARVHAIKYGWICVLLGIVPGVAVGFAAYLLIRMDQLKKRAL
jgi:hypothetical protein